MAKQGIIRGHWKQYNNYKCTIEDFVNIELHRNVLLALQFSFIFLVLLNNLASGLRAK